MHLTQYSGCAPPPAALSIVEWLEKLITYRNCAEAIHDSEFRIPVEQFTKILCHLGAIPATARGHLYLLIKEFERVNSLVTNPSSYHRTKQTSQGGGALRGNNRGGRGA